jgi:hypothetical protein
MTTADRSLSARLSSTREKLWYLFCRDILWESWKEFLTNETQSGYVEFERAQTQLWVYFEKMERALLKVHGNRCSQLAQFCNLFSSQQPQQHTVKATPQQPTQIDAATMALWGSPFAAIMAAQAAFAQANAFASPQAAALISQSIPTDGTNFTLCQER